MEGVPENCHEMTPDVHDEDRILPPLLHVAQHGSYHLLLQLLAQVSHQVVVGGNRRLKHDRKAVRFPLELCDFAIQEDDDSLVPHGHH